MSLRISSLYVALFLSGSAALVYQSTWGRMLQRVFGVGDLAVATVLAAFFLGLGLGAALGGSWAKRLERPAMAYAVLELGIGVYALASLLLIPNVHSLYAAIGHGASFTTLTIIRLVLAMIILLPPTILMGATLPILVKVVAKSGAELDWGSSATGLYATNTFGAMIGAGATGLFLVPELGTRASIVIAAVASLAGAALVAGLWRRADAPARPATAEPAEPEPAEPEAESPEAARPETPAAPSYLKTAIALAAIAGCAALASEVLWTRVLRIIVQGTTPAFAAMLVNYLFGIAVGSLIADRLVRRYKKPLALFGVTQILLAALTVGAMYVAPHLPRLMGLLAGEAMLEPHQTWIVLVLSTVLLLPIALVLGTSIPLAWHIAGGDEEQAPEYAGRVLAWNTIGGLFGSLCAGFLLVPAIGMEASLLVVMIVHGLAAALAFRQAAGLNMGYRIAGLVGPAVVVGGAMLLQPTLEIPFLLHARNDPVNAIIAGPGEEWQEQVVFLQEGRNTTVTILHMQGEDLLRLYNDGRPESGFGGGEPGFGPELSTLGALPNLLAEQRERAMVIGLGAGHTTTVLLGAPWERIDVIELEEAVVDAARYLHEAKEADFPLDDPRTHLIVDDARARLVLAEPDTYDTVVSQPSHPWLAGSSALYTREFFEEARRAIRPGGVIACWVNLFRTDLEHLQSVVATLLSVFPYAHAFVVEDSSFILVGSERPIPLDERAASRLREEDLRPYMEPQGLADLIDLASVREFDSEGLRTFGEGAPLVIDDRPSLEFDLARTPTEATVLVQDLDAADPEVPWISRSSFEALPERDRVDVLMVRLSEVEHRRAGLRKLELSVEGSGMEPRDQAYVEGAIAEARGDMRRALERYDAAGSALAAEAADTLRHAEGMYWRVLQAATARDVTPLSARLVLSAAVAVNHETIARRALEIAAEADDPGDDMYIEVIRAWVDGGCPAVMASESLDAATRADEHLAFLGQRCAILEGDVDLASELGEIRTRVRRAAAIREHKAGTASDNAGIRRAAMHRYRRALRYNPAHGPAAGGLARILVDLDREEEATEILRTALDAAEGLPQSTGAINSIAGELNIRLGADADEDLTEELEELDEPPEDEE